MKPDEMFCTVAEFEKLTRDRDALLAAAKDAKGLLLKAEVNGSVSPFEAIDWLQAVINKAESK